MAISIRKVKTQKRIGKLFCGECKTGIILVNEKIKGDEHTINIRKCTDCGHQYGLKGIGKLQQITRPNE